MLKSVHEFPETLGPNAKNMTYMPSFYKNVKLQALLTH